MTVKITALQLRQFSGSMPETLAMKLAPALQAECNKGTITTNRRLRHFMAQIAHESAGMVSLVESLNYKTEALIKLFGRHRISLVDAHKFGRGPGRVAHQNALANILYGGPFGRENLGNTEPGDGWRYRGRSPIMATGRVNYELLQKVTGLPLVTNPDMAGDPQYGALIAVAWWDSKKLSPIADKDVGEKVYAKAKDGALANEMDDVTALRLKINGGKNGLDDTKEWLVKAAQVWPD